VLCLSEEHMESDERHSGREEGESARTGKELMGVVVVVVL